MDMAACKHINCIAWLRLSRACCNLQSTGHPFTTIVIHGSSDLDPAAFNLARYIATLRLREVWLRFRVLVPSLESEGIW
jgi:hypothetical protein